MAAASGSLSAHAQVFVPSPPSSSSQYKQGTAATAQPKSGQKQSLSGGRTSLRTALSSGATVFVPGGARANSNWAPSAQASQGYWPCSSTQYAGDAASHSDAASYCDDGVSSYGAGMPQFQAGAYSSPEFGQAFGGGTPQSASPAWTCHQMSTPSGELVSTSPHVEQTYGYAQHGSEFYSQQHADDCYAQQPGSECYSQEYATEFYGQQHGGEWQQDWGQPYDTGTGFSAGCVVEPAASMDKVIKRKKSSSLTKTNSTEADDDDGHQTDSEDTPSTQATQEHFRDDRQSDDTDEEWMDCNEQVGGRSNSSADHRPASASGDANGSSSTTFSRQELLRWRAVALQQPFDKKAIRCCVAAEVEKSRGARTDPKGNARREGRSPQAAPERLEASPTSWVAAQKSHRSSSDGFGTPSAGTSNGDRDAEVVRNIRSVLNKLTVERFEANYQKLIDTRIRSQEHIEVLMREVFEKATAQHHFIPMYAELCTRLNAWFVKTQGPHNGKMFKKILLNRCQLSFEETLNRPESFPALHGLSHEERIEAEIKHKTRTLGNLKLVGALLEKGMLASRILMAVVEELLGEPTSASLECLAVFLTAVGPTFDRYEWVHHPHLCATFDAVERQLTRPDLAARTRCLLQDVLDLRASNWENTKKARRTEAAPTTLEDVHRQAQEESAACRPQGGARAAPVTYASPAASSRHSRSQPQRAAQRAYDEASFNEELCRMLAKVSRGANSRETLDRLAAFKVPSDQQAALVANMLSHAAEGRHSQGRRAGFRLVAELISTQGWQRSALPDGLAQFFGESFDELRLDLPMLPQIVREDLLPELKVLVDNGNLEKRWLPTASALDGKA